MSPSFPAFFIRSASTLLFLTAAAKLYSATGTDKILNHSDSFFLLSNRSLMLGVGLIELAVAGYLVLGKNPLAKFSAVLWLSSNFLLYRLGNYLADFKTCPCLGTVFNKLGMDGDGVNFLMTASVIYLFAGSVYCLQSHFRELRGHAPATLAPTEASFGS